MKTNFRLLTPEQIKSVVRWIANTRDDEADCGECLRRIGEFAERDRAGLPLDEALRCIHHHLMACPECREEHLALARILESAP